MSVVWIVGLAASGKSTIGNALWEQWQKTEPNTGMLDCSESRAENVAPSAFSVEGRRHTEQTLLQTCYQQTQAGYNVVACSIALFEDLRVWARMNLPNYFEVYVQAPMSTIERRDTLGIYSGARKGKIRNVVGVDIPWKPPETADFVVDTGPQGLHPSVAAGLILRRMANRRAA